MEDNIEIEINKSKIYRCTEYKTLNKCKSLIILNDKKEVLKYESLHNHLEKEIDVSISVAKHKIKEEIKKNSIPMDIKIYLMPTIRSQIIRNINKQFPPNIKSFDDIPIESEYYKTKRNENFMIFKNTDLIIFQSPFQAYLFSNYHKNIFADGTFYEAPKFSYQLFITRTYVGEFNMFYTTSISILKNKKQSTYETLFKEIKKNANKFRSNTLITTINFNCDFEQGISNAAKKVFPNINIKYCDWHYKRSLEKQKNILCYHEVKNNNDYNNFLQFLEYFNKNNLLKYNVNNWNYYENIEHLTNNASESYNSYLNNIFPNKPLFYKLIYILKEEEKLSYNDYQRRTKGNWKKKQKIFSATDEIKILIENYKSKEINLFYNGCNRNELVKLWKDCLIDLNDININLK
ncbi:hypothetical protein H8356DRAFT_1361693 [Neocallimastix lanati (nom. inval.)]|nr:hypothetical protein H8356DRAFT_1361693 [Neocallimastix sp. JGI-2020a]